MCIRAKSTVSLLAFAVSQAVSCYTCVNGCNGTPDVVHSCKACISATFMGEPMRMCATKDSDCTNFANNPHISAACCREDKCNTL